MCKFTPKKLYEIDSLSWRHDTQHNDTQQNDDPHDYTQHNNKSKAILSINDTRHDNTLYIAIMRSIIMLRVVILSVHSIVMLSVIMLRILD